MKRNFGEFFTHWLSFQERYAEALGCYSTTVYHRLPSSVEHLCLTQALDAYHGVRFSSHGKRDFKAKVEELCQQGKETLSGLVDNIPKFAETVRDTRDYYTHHNPDDLNKRQAILAGSALIRLNEKVKILFQSSILSEIGIPADRFRRLRRQIASEIIEY